MSIMMNIVYWNKLTLEDKNTLLQRSTLKNDTLYQQTIVIMEQVKKAGDEALIQLTEKFDKTTLRQIAVTEKEFKDGYSKIEEASLSAIRSAIKRISTNTKAQLPDNWIYDSKDGIVCERQARAIGSVGLYVPGGTAPLVSTVLMLGIPALVAGCQQRVLCTPPSPDGCIDPNILVAAKECKIQNVYKVGGAQAIAAMTYGTQTIPKVDKIFGPGNQWVTKAKQLCAQNECISIDMPAGPSELLIIADETANPNFVAADLLSQAEHDAVAQVFLVTSNERVANQVKICLLDQLKTLPRYAIAMKSLEKSKIIIVDSLLDAFEVSNLYAPEHLSIQLRQPEQYMSKIKNAGTVFLGDWSAEALGDYNTGANHILPTSGYTRTLSGLSVLDFMKWIGFQQVSQSGLVKIGKDAAQLARIEKLNAHENAVNLRLKEIEANA